MCAHALTHDIMKHVLLQHLSDRITFAIQELMVGIMEDVLMVVIPCGMGLGVALPAPAVPSTTLHGSTSSCHSPQPMT